MVLPVLKNINDWINSFRNNNNTGNEYEICVGISILLGSGLTTREELPEIYKELTPFKESSSLSTLARLTDPKRGGIL